MAREISIKDEYFVNSDEGTLRAVLNALSKEFLFISLDDFRIEVNDADYSAVVGALGEYQRDIELNSPR